MRLAHCSFLCTILKRQAPVQYGSVVGVRVDSKRNLNASHALLVLEHNIKKGRQAPVQCGSCGPPP